MPMFKLVKWRTRSTRPMQKLECSHLRPSLFYLQTVLHRGERAFECLSSRHFRHRRLLSMMMTKRARRMVLFHQKQCGAQSSLTTRVERGPTGGRAKGEVMVCL